MKKANKHIEPKRYRLNNISVKEIKDKYPELVGQFITELPDKIDDRETGAYYVAKTGKFVRVIEKDGEKVTIGMDEPGFKDKPKKK